jgi:hypothetical protein
MLPRHGPAPQAPRRFGVGIDTSRYGHYAAFLKDDLQPAAAELAFAESAAGYASLRQRLERIVQQHGPGHFVVRRDVAGPYAENLLYFLHRLGTPVAGAAAAPAPGASAPFTLTLSCGDPQRNKNYRAALFGGKKSDPVEARTAARFALTAFILDIDRFATPGKRVGYFGVVPVEVASGVARDGQPRGPRRRVMSRRGNDLVRR